MQEKQERAVLAKAQSSREAVHIEEDVLAYREKERLKREEKERQLKAN